MNQIVNNPFLQQNPAYGNFMLPNSQALQMQNFGFNPIQTAQMGGTSFTGVPAFSANSMAASTGFQPLTTESLAQSTFGNQFAITAPETLAANGMNAAPQSQNFLGDMSFSDTVGLGLGAIQTFLGYQTAQDKLDIMQGNLDLSREGLQFKKDQYQNRLDAGNESRAADKQRAANQNSGG